MGAESTFVNRCSLVVRAVDLWTGFDAPPSSIRVRIRGIDKPPLRVSDGSYAFLDYPGDRCVVTVASADYLDYEREVALGEAVPILTAGLMPSRVRANPAAGSGLRFRVIDGRTGKPASGARVLAFIDDDRAVAGRVAEETPDKGTGALKVSPGLYKLLPGEAFALRGKVGAPEWYQVSEYFDAAAGDERIRLEQPLGRACVRGEKLLPAAATRSEADGTTTVPFRGILPAEFQVAVEARLGDRRAIVSMTAAGGEVRRVPDIIVP